MLNELVTKGLIPNGSEVLLTENNKKEFVEKICEMKMKVEIQEELEAFIKGFHMIIPPEWLEQFSPYELQMLIAGNPTVDIEELKKTALYYKYKADDDIVRWMWEILEEFNEKERGAFIFFISGKINSGNHY